jgi:hypothetical protein
LRVGGRESPGNRHRAGIEGPHPCISDATCSPPVRCRVSLRSLSDRVPVDGGIRATKGPACVREDKMPAGRGEVGVT